MWWVRTGRAPTFQKSTSSAADRSPVATRLAYAGTIKWLDHAPLDQADLSRLAADVVKVPGADASFPLIAVSRSGVTAVGATTLGPEDLIAAW